MHESQSYTHRMEAVGAIWEAFMAARRVMYPILTNPAWATVFALVATMLSPAYCPRRVKRHPTPKHGLPGQTLRVCMAPCEDLGCKTASSTHQDSSTLEVWLRMAGVPFVKGVGELVLPLSDFRTLHPHSMLQVQGSGALKGAFLTCSMEKKSLVHCHTS